MTRWFPIAPGTTLPAAPAAVAGQLTVTKTVPVWNETVLLAARTKTQLIVDNYDYDLSLLTELDPLATHTLITASALLPPTLISVPVLNVALFRARAVFVVTGGGVNVPSTDFGFEQSAVTVSSGAGVLPVTSNVELAAIAPAYLGAAATIIEAPSSLTGLNAFAPTIEGGISIAAPASEISLSAGEAVVDREQPRFVAASAANSGTGSISLSWPSGHQLGDVALLVIETSGSDSTLAAASGWSAVTGSPVVDVAAATGSKLQVWWRRATSAAESAVATGDAGDHQVARMYVFRGCVSTGDPWDVIATGTKAVGSATATVPSLTTTRFNTRVVMIVGRPDDSSSTTHFGLPVNAGLGGIASHGEAGTISGNGGGFTVASGSKALKGVTGTSTLTKTASTTDTYFVLALRGY